MPRPCTICQHPDKGAVEVDLLTGGPGMTFRLIAERYGLKATSLVRHRDNCMGERGALATTVRDKTLARGEAVAAKAADRGAEVARSVLDRADAVLRPLESMLEQVAKAMADPGTTGEELGRLREEYPKAAKVALDFFRTLGAASGEIPQGGPLVSITMGADVAAAIEEERAALLSALAAEGVDRLTVARVARRLAGGGEAVVQANQVGVVVTQGGRR